MTRSPGSPGERDMCDSADVLRRRGYAIDDEERTEGMRCVAAAIFNAPGDPIGGISVSGPSGRMSAQVIAKAGALVHEAAAQITHSLGGGSGASR